MARGPQGRDTGPFEKVTSGFHSPGHHGWSEHHGSVMSTAGNLSEQRVRPLPVPDRRSGPPGFLPARGVTERRLRGMAPGDARHVLSRATEPAPLSGEQMDEIG